MLQSKFDSALDLLLKGVKAEKLAVAVSGGSDSVALLYLASNWARKHGVRLYVFSVDHNLRPESKDEITFVDNLSKQLGHDFYGFSWQGDDVKSGLQEKARTARYDLMSAKCHQLGIRVLLTAHHLDDMLETYLMRKRKKSGVFGLSSSPCFFYNDIEVLRPLYEIEKADIISYLKKHNIKWLEDVSNKSNKYERNRLRKEIAEYDKRKRRALIAELDVANKEAAELNGQLLEAIVEFVQINEFGFASIDLDGLAKLSLDIKIQILGYVLNMISGKVGVPRYRSLYNVIPALGAKTHVRCHSRPPSMTPEGAQSNIKTTLHGCVLRQGGEQLFVFREKAGIGEASSRGNEMTAAIHPYCHSRPSSLESMTQLVRMPEYGSSGRGPRMTLKGSPRMTSGRGSYKKTIWDNRFQITFTKKLAADFSVSALGFDDYLKLKGQLDLSSLAKISANNHKLLLFTLPVIKNLEKVVAIPHISYYDGFDQNLIKDVIFAPSFTSRFTHFL